MLYRIRPTSPAPAAPLKHPLMPVHTADAGLMGALHEYQTPPPGSMFEADYARLNARRAIDLYRDEPMLSGAIRVASEQAMLGSLVAQKVDQDGSYTALPRSHWLSRVLRTINPMSGPSQFARDIRSWTMLYAAYIAIEFRQSTDPRRPNATDLQLYPLLPQNLSPFFDENGVLQGYAYDTPGSSAEPLIFAPSQIIPMTNFMPETLFTPLSSLEGIRDVARITPYLYRRAGQYYATQSVLPAIIQTDKELSGKERLTVERSFAEALRNGMTRRNRLLVLDQGMNYIPLKEASPIDVVQGGDSPTLRMVASAIYAATGVPVELFSRASEVRERGEWLPQLWQQNLLPFYRLLSEHLTRRLAEPFDQTLAVIADTRDVMALAGGRLNLTRVQVAEVASGIRTLNEERQQNNDPPYTGEAAKVANLPPAAHGQITNGASPSLTLPGSEGGRDKTDQGEAGMIDTTGKRSVLDEMFFETIMNQVVGDKTTVE